MEDERGMNEHRSDGSTPAVLVIDLGRLLYIGRVDTVPTHRCVATVVGFGLDGEFTVETDAARRDGRVVTVPAGTSRAVDARGGRLGVLILDTGLAFDDCFDQAPALALVERLSGRWSVEDWGRLLDILDCRSSRATDARIEAAAAEVLAASEENLPTAAIAARVGLSASRLEHRFREVMGTPMRSYRTWCRFRAVALSMARGRDLTTAACDAGFYDSAHFTHAFRQSFGITPSFVFRPGLEIHVAG